MGASWKGDGRSDTAQEFESLFLRQFIGSVPEPDLMALSRKQMVAAMRHASLNLAASATQFPAM